MGWIWLKFAQGFYELADRVCQKGTEKNKEKKWAKQGLESVKLFST